jgi:spermidine synthase
MKLPKTPTSLAASPAEPGEATMAAALSLAAGFLLSCLPLLFVQGTRAWFSDAPAVWTYSLGFVIAAAALGAGAGRVAGRRLSWAAGRWLLTLLLMAAFASMPLLPDPGAFDPAPVNAALELLRLLLMEAGPAAIALGWFLGRQLADVEEGSGSVSMLIGLMLGPIVYLMILDPLLRTSRLDIYFSWSLAAFALAAIVWLWQSRSRAPGQRAKGDRADQRPGWLGVVECGLFGAIVALLIVVSAGSMNDSVSTPKLWVLPCLIAIIAFSAGRFRPALQRPGVIAGLQSLSAVALTVALYYGSTWPLTVMVPLLYAGLAAGVLSLAATSARLAIRHSGSRNRSLSLVGIVIAVPLVTVVPQRLATDTTEFPLTILAAATLVLLALAKTGSRKRPVLFGVFGLVLLLVALGFNFYGRNLNAVGRVRTFYGVTTAVGVGSGADAYLLMRSGDAPRAAQFIAEDVRFEPTLFHGRNTGIGLLFRSLPKGNFRRVGIIGVGNGDLVAYAHPTDVFRLYEFDPGPARMAGEGFTYLPYADTNVWQLIPGDPRLVLERAEPERFDVLILDTFSGGYLPTHLLTAEAFAIWRKHLAPDGVIAVNLTNRRFDLVSVVWRQAIEQGLKLAPAFTSPNAAAGLPATEWVFLTNNPELLSRPGIKAAGEKETAEAARLPLWTDEAHEPLSRLK